MRHDGRENHQLRELKFETGAIIHHPGSVLVSFGNTKVMVTATLEERVPPFRLNSGGGWMTAEYGMLPAATHNRKQRDAAKGKVDGRSTEIQRLIGRALRNVVNVDVLGRRTIHIDCDVLQADGGTRCASITGAYVAVHLCVQALLKRKPQDMKAKRLDQVITGQVAAVSMGMLKGTALTDLDYVEDSSADTDLNLIARSDGSLVEIQGTAEGAPLQREELNKMLDQGMDAIALICKAQNEALAAAAEAS
ncbi:MAG: ribonuclease PH [Deltaproteobacteria bacterium]|nr:ribonuclease PH [Deltaproteobacteria bacterium]